MGSILNSLWTDNGTYGGKVPVQSLESNSEQFSHLKNSEFDHGCKFSSGRHLSKVSSQPSFRRRLKFCRRNSEIDQKCGFMSN